MSSLRMQLNKWLYAIFISCFFLSDLLFCQTKQPQQEIQETILRVEEQKIVVHDKEATIVKYLLNTCG